MTPNILQGRTPIDLICLVWNFKTWSSPWAEGHHLNLYVIDAEEVCFACSRGTQPNWTGDGVFLWLWI